MNEFEVVSAVANAGTQLSMTGSVNWGKVGQSALGGAIGAGMSYGIGELMGHGYGTLGEFAAKTGAHSVSGGIQSWAMGGNFGSGMVSGGIGYTSGAIGTGLGGEGGGFAGSTLGGGVGAWATGGDFYTGAQTGALGYLFNHMGEKMVDAGMDMVNKVDNWLNNKNVSVGVTVDWFGVNGSVGIGQGPALATALQTPNLGVGFYGSWNPARSKNLVVIGAGRSAGIGGYFSDKGVPRKGAYGSVGVALPIPITGYRSL